MKWLSNNRLINAVLFLSIGLTVLIFGISHKQGKWVADTQKELLQSLQSLQAINQIFTSINQFRTSTHAYLINGDSSSLANVEEAKERIKGNLKVVREKDLYETENLVLLDSLSYFIQKRFQVNLEIIKTYSQGEGTQPDHREALEESNYLDNRIMGVSQILWNSETAKFREKGKANTFGIHNLNTFLYVTMGLLILLSLFFYTRIRRSFEQRRLGEEKLKALLNAVPDAIIIVNNQCKIQLANQEAVRLTGYSHAELLQMQADDLVPEEEKVHHAETRNLHGLSPFRLNTHKVVEEQIKRKDQSLLSVEVTLSPVTIGKESYLIAASRGISERKAAEKEIRQLYSQINQASEAICIINKDLTFRSWNQGAENMFGYTQDEVIGKDARQLLLTEKEQEKYRGVDESSLNGDHWSGDLQVRTKNARILMIHHSMTAIRDQRGMITGYVSVSINITESAKLRKQVEYLAKITEQTADAIISIDMDQKILSWNHGACLLHGFQAEEVIGRYIDELNIYHFERGELQKNIERFQRKGKWSIETTLYRKDGSSFYGMVEGTIISDDNGEPVSVVFVAHDITARKELEERLKMDNTELESIVSSRNRELLHSEMKYKYLFENNPMPMLIYENSTHRLRNANQAASELYGYSKEEFLRLTLADLQPASEQERFLSNDLTEHTKVPRHKRAWLHARKDGSPIQVEIFSHPMEYEGATAQLMLVWDVTEKLQMEDQLIAEHEMLSSIAASSPGLIYTFRRSPDGQYSCPYSSQAAEDLYGFRPDEIHEDFNIILSRIHAEDLDKVLTSVEDSFQHMSQWSSQFRFHHPVKGLVWLQGNSVPSKVADGSVYWNGFLMDISEIKKAEEKINQQRAQLKTISDNLPGLMIYQVIVGESFADRKFTYFSKEVTKLTGKSVEEVMEDPAIIYNMVYADDLPGLIEAEQKALEKKTKFEADIRMQLPSGEIRHYHLTSIPRVNLNGQWVWDGFKVDITDRIKSQEAIRLSNERFELVSRATREMIWDWDIEQDVIWRNDNYYSHYGYVRTNGNGNGQEESKEEVSWLRHVHADDRERVCKAFQHCIREHRPFWKDEYRFLRSDGSSALVSDCGYVLYNEQGKAYRMVGAMEDITEIRNTENELQHSFDTNKQLTERLSSIINTLPARIALLDNNGSLMEVNNAWKHYNRVAGIPVLRNGIGEDYTHGVMEIVCKNEDGVQMSKGIKAVLNRAVPEFQHEYICNKRGSKHWYRMIVTSLENENYSGAVVMHLDISQLRKLEEEKLKAKTLEQRAITEAMLKGQEKERNAIAIELHDNVNQILTGTKIMLSLAKEFPGKAEEVVPVCIENIEMAVAENRKIAHELVTPNLAKESLKQQIEKLCKSMLNLAGFKTTVEAIQYTPGLLSKEKQLALYRITQEQCTNIIKYSGGSLVEFELQVKDGVFRLGIADNGKGMETGQVIEGIGLRNIASRLDVFGGSMQVETAPGMGFKLMVELPI